MTKFMAVIVGKVKQNRNLTCFFEIQHHVSKEIETFSFSENKNELLKENPPQFTDTDSDGVLFDKLKNQILRYPVAKKDTSYTIPAGITSIRKDAFYGCDILKTVHLSRKVSIPEKDFFKNTVQFVYTD